MDDKREARGEGGRRFQREGAIAAKDLDMAMVVLVRGTKSSRLYRDSESLEDEGRRQRSEVNLILLILVITMLECESSNLSFKWPTGHRTVLGFLPYIQTPIDHNLTPLE